MAECQHPNIISQDEGLSEQRICHDCGAIVEDHGLHAENDYQYSGVNCGDDYVPPIHYQDSFKCNDVNTRFYFKKKRIIDDVRLVVNRLRIEPDDSFIVKAADTYLQLMNIVSATKCKTAIIFECIKLNHTYPSSLPGLHVASARLGISLKKFTHAKKYMMPLLRATSNEVAAGPICGKAEKNLNVVSDCLKAQCLNIPPDISGVCLKLCGLLSQYNLLSFHNPFETARAILEYVSTIFHNNSIEKVYSRKISESGVYNLRIQKINSLMLPVFGVLKRNEDVPLTWDLFIECLNFIEASSYRQICALIDSNSRKYRFLMNKIKSYRDEYESERYEYDNHQIKYDSHKGVIMHLIHSGYSDEDISKVDVDSICREYHVDRLSNMSEQDFDREVSLDIKTFVEKKMWSNLLH